MSTRKPSNTPIKIWKQKCEHDPSLYIRTQRLCEDTMDQFKPLLRIHSKDQELKPTPDFGVAG